MNPNDNLTVNKVGAPKTEAAEPIASYSAAAAESGMRIQDPATNPLTPGRTTQTQAAARPYDANFGSITMGFSLKDAFTSMGYYNVTGLDPMSGTHLNGSYEYQNSAGRNLNLEG